MRLRLRLAPRLLFETHSESAPCRCGAGPNREEAWVVSLMPSLAPPKGYERFSAKLVSGDYEYAVRFRICDVDYSQVPTIEGLSHGDSRAITTWAIFHGSSHYLLNFRLRYIVSVDMRKVRKWIDVVPDSQAHTFLFFLRLTTKFSSGAACKTSRLGKPWFRPRLLKRLVSRSLIPAAILLDATLAASGFLQADSTVDAELH